MTGGLSWGVGVLAALPWVVVPLVVVWRLRDSTSLDAYAPDAPDDAPLVSIVVPARDEARNIQACIGSILATAWPRVELIVVNDRSSDGTGDLARAIDDARVTVVDAPDLPEGWIGKQWACHNGARAATGSFLLFTDADTRHTPELLPRAMTALGERGADLFTVAGAQAMQTFWERLLQPHVFGMLGARFGGTERASASRNPHDKIANGQFMLLRRDVYERTGGHEAVRTHIAEDLRMAQAWTAAGYSVQIVTAFDFMSTRMYEGFGELWRGWGKNMWAAGRDTIAGGPAVRLVIRVLSPCLPLWEILPAVALLLALAGALPMALGVWGAVAFAANTLFWAGIQVAFRAPAWYALLHPLAACVLVGMFVRASWRGDRVEWKGRSYRSRLS